VRAMLLTLGERRKVYSTVCFGGDTHLEDLGVDGRILGERGPWTGFIWLRMGSCGDGTINAGTALSSWGNCYIL
jgi:hypothetical protein